MSRSLDYATPAPPNRSRWAIFALGCVVLLAVAGVLGGRQIAATVTARRAAAAVAAQRLADAKFIAQWSRQMAGDQAFCESYTAPADQVVCEEQPDLAQSLLADHSYRQWGSGLTQTAAIRSVAAWNEIARYVGYRDAGCIRTGPTNGGFGTWDGATAYLHARTDPSGTARLVVVEFTAVSLRHYVFKPLCFAAGTAVWNLTNSTPSQQNVAIVLPPDAHIRVYAGQTDPADESHFTIRYVCDGHSGMIDGWLDRGGLVRLQPQTGRTQRRGPLTVWQPSPEPASTATLPAWP